MDTIFQDCAHGDDCFCTVADETDIEAVTEVYPRSAAEESDWWASLLELGGEMQMPDPIQFDAEEWE